MNFKRFFIAPLLVLLLAGVSLAPVSAQDEGEIDARFSAEGGGGCSIGSGSTGFGLNISYATPVDLDFTVTVIAGADGIRGSSDSGIISAGEEEAANFSVSFESEAIESPWDLVMQFDTFLDGDLITRAHGRVSCTSDGYAAEPLSFSRITVKSAQLSSGVMFDDTRIEMEIGEAETGRFGLYSTIDSEEQPVLLVFRTDDSGNDRVIYRVSEADIAEFVGSPPLNPFEISAQRGMRLVATPDGLFRLEIAPPGAEERYMIVFDGLPLGFAFGQIMDEPAG